MTKPAIGFIGLGMMGSAMVTRLLDLGYRMTLVANRARPNVDAAVAAGASEVATARAVAEHSDIVMLCMDTSANVESRMLGDDGVIAGLKPGATVIDFGTSLPASTRDLGQKVAAAGGAYLDAPLGRTPAHAKQGQLNIMTSGDKSAFERVKPVLDDLGENVFYLGALGSGHTIKLINNFFAMTTASAMSEAFVMADVAGIDRQALYGVMSAGPLHSGMMDFVAAYALHNDKTKLEFSISNAGKDVGYYEQMSKEAGASTMMAGCALEALRAAKADGRGDDVVCQMLDFFASRMNG